MSNTDSVTVSALVAVDPATAFEVFTDDIDIWWKRSPRYRMSTDRQIRFEPGEGGRLLTYEESGAVHELGRIRIWKPGERIVFEWRAREFEPDQTTEVEVRFEPDENGTRITLEHRGWDSLPDDLPLRHGVVGEAFLSMFGLWWADLLVALRAHAQREG